MTDLSLNTLFKKQEYDAPVKVYRRGVILSTCVLPVLLKLYLNFDRHAVIRDLYSIRLHSLTHLLMQKLPVMRKVCSHKPGMFVRDPIFQKSFFQADILRKSHMGCIAWRQRIGTISTVHADQIYRMRFMFQNEIQRLLRWKTRIMEVS